MSKNIFKYKQFKSKIIMLCVRWYLKYPLSYRNLVEMMAERGINITHTTIMRWVHEFSPILDKSIRPYLSKCNHSWRVDETYIKIKGKWTYLYRAVDSKGNTIDFYLSKNRDKQSVKNFFKKAIKSVNTTTPRVITVDKNPAYPRALSELTEDNILNKKVTLRQIKYLNNIVEQDHRFIKRKVRSTLGFKSFDTANNTIKGIEIMNMLRKGQVNFRNYSDLIEVNFINNIMGITA